MTLIAGGALCSDKPGVIIVPLTRENFPVIKTLHFSTEVDFTNHCRLIAIFLEDLLELLLVVIKGAAITGHAVFVAVFTGENHSTAGGAYGIDTKVFGKNNSFFSYRVDMRGIDEFVFTGIRADGLSCMIITKNK